MHAIILAGGFGTRLRPLTINFPKPMVPVANQPMMEHVVRLLEHHGFKNLLAMLHYSPDVIKRYFESGKNWDVAISYLVPEIDLGTAGCIRFAADNENYRELNNEPFLVISGDLLSDINLTKAWQFHIEKKSAATVILTRTANPLPYGVVLQNDEGKIVRFLEKPTWGEVFSDTINTGIYILNPEVVKLIPPDQSFDFSKDLLPKLMELGMPLYGYIAEGYWKDVGDLTEYRFSQIDILENKISVKIFGEPLKDHPHVRVGENCHIDPNVEFKGTVVIGKNCHISRGAEINQSIIGNNVQIGAGASVRRSVIWDGSFIGPESALREAVISRFVNVGPRARVDVGAVIADRCAIGADAVIKPSVKMWPEKSVEDGAVLSSSLVWGEKWNRGLFGTSGITGLTNIEITPEFAAKLGAAYGAFLGQGAYVITSRDAHRASRLIKRAIISGLMSSGVRVGDLRMLPVPVLRYEMGKEGEAGAVHVRQSPFDTRIMDIRIFDRDGNDIPVRKEKAIEQLFMREDFKRAEVQDVGDLTVPPRAQEYYRTGFLEIIKTPALKRRKFKIIIDYSHSPAAMIFPDLLGELGIESVALNAHTIATRVTRSSEEFRKSLDQLSNIVKTLKADAGFLMDNGAEKLFLVDENGRIIPPEEAMALVGSLYLQTDTKDIICYPVRGSSALERFANMKGVTVMRTPMTPRNILEYASRPNVGFVAEPEGGFIFPKFQPAFDGMFALAKILEMLAEQDSTLAKSWEQFPEKINVSHKRVPCGWACKGQVMRNAQVVANGQVAELIDGVKIHFVDGWVLILPDPSEAYCHVWAEAQNKARSRELLDEFTAKVVEWQKPAEAESMNGEEFPKVAKAEISKKKVKSEV